MGTLAAGGVLTGTLPWLNSMALDDEKKPNIILLLDTLTARNMSLYGYERQTTPNFERLASRMTVYHSHYSGGNYTTPGTASLLTGLYPWHHRAINLRAPMDREKVGSNIFHLMGSSFRKLGFAQNTLANQLLSQFNANIDEHVPFNAFCGQMTESRLSRFFPSDPVVAHYAFDDFLIRTSESSNKVYGSAYLGYLELFYGLATDDYGNPSDDYPRGMPSNGVYYFDNRVVYSGVFQMIQELNKAGQPYFGYFHLFSPHSRYRPRKEFIGKFPEIPIPYKKRHKLGNHIRQLELNGNRMNYDEYIADVDNELGRLFDKLEADGVLDNSYFIITSDHGELFERGETGHNSFLLYDPIIHIPLLISSPGQTERRDIYTRTSSVDVLPTLLNLMGREIPSMTDGVLLPGFGGEENTGRSIFAVEAKTNSAFAPLKRATITLMKENYKVIYFGDYPRYSEVFELYDLHDDPEEKHDLFLEGATIGLQLKEELLDTLAMVNKPYARKL